MPRPKTDLHLKVQEILRNVEPLTAAADTPITHYSKSANQLWTLWTYVNQKLSEAPHYPAVLTRHMDQLNSMVLLHLIETFERFLKELAALCVDRLAPNLPDDRLRKFSADGAVLAVHFQTDTLGRALFESLTWLDCDTVKERFQTLLRPVAGGK